MWTDTSINSTACFELIGSLTWNTSDVFWEAISNHQLRGTKAIGTKANLVLAAAAGVCTIVVTQPLNTASSRMQTSEFGKSKGLWKSVSENTWSGAFDGLGISLLLTANPSIQDSELDIIDGVGAEAGYVIRTTIGGRNGQIQADCQLHSRTFGWNWFFRCCLPSKMPREKEIVAIKKVLQDKRYKNRELQIMKMMDYPNVVLKHCH
ncbi:hypothetical protein ACSBR1_031530 [Camellia fascicularis]